VESEKGKNPPLGQRGATAFSGVKGIGYLPGVRSWIPGRFRGVGFGWWTLDSGKRVREEKNSAWRARRRKYVVLCRTPLRQCKRTAGADLLDFVVVSHRDPLRAPHRTKK
jgi:hypothetical protein